MTDIVERLRDYINHDEDEWLEYMLEAADEIEQMRTWEAEARACHLLLFEKDAEIERLRAALQAVAALPPVDGLDPFEANRRGQEFRLNEQAREIARNALEPKP